MIGGAGKASYRLHDGLRAAGHSSKMIVLRKVTADEDVVAMPGQAMQLMWLRLRRRLAGSKGDHAFNFDRPPLFGSSFISRCPTNRIDIICLHWINGLLTAEMIRDLWEHYRCPIVWTLSDQEPVTGGCHYSFGCIGYTKQCGNCPQIRGAHMHDASNILWRRKFDCLHELPITFVAPTSWVERKIQESSLFGEHYIARIQLPIDGNIFCAADRLMARRKLQIAKDKKVVFFGASILKEPRKGIAHLLEALDLLHHNLQDNSSSLSTDNVLLLYCGEDVEEMPTIQAYERKYLGRIDDDHLLALAYQAADIFVCPSLEDAGPMMVPESMMCGTPVVAFDTGGVPDLVQTMETGYLAIPGDSSDLAHGIQTLLLMDRLDRMRKACRKAACLAHDTATVIRRHANLYDSLVSN